MKLHFTLFLALLGLAVSAMAQATADRELSLKCTQALQRGIAQTLGEGTPPMAQAARMVVEVEDQVERDGQVVIGARFSVVLDNRLIHAMTAGAIGVGQDEAAAREDLVLTWLGQYGGPLVYFLTDKPGMEMDGLHVYTGPIARRRQIPGNWIRTDELHRRVIHALREECEAELTVIDLKLGFARDGVIEGWCRINGEPSARALNQLLAIDWPPDSGFLLNQFYIVANPLASTDEAVP